MPTNEQRLKSWSEFISAVHAGKRGNYEPARQLVARVREKFGDAAAKAQRREIWRVIKAGEPK